MTEQKPMSTGGQQADPRQAEQDKQRRLEEARQRMQGDRNLEDRIRASHPHLGESDDAFKAAMDDFERLRAEQQKAGGDHPHGGPPGQTGDHPQGGAPGQNKPRAEPR